MNSLLLLLTFFLLSVVLTLVNLVRAYFRLSGVPGPKLASFTDVWRLRAQNSPQYSVTIARLHKQYGKLVRIGPNHVSISDPGAVPIVYSTRPVWDKVGDTNYYDFFFFLKKLNKLPIAGSIIQTSCPSKPRAPSSQYHCHE